MDEGAIARCHEYARAVFGKTLKASDSEELLSICTTYEEFRIRLVLKFSQRTEMSKKLAAHWEEHACQTDDLSDANFLFHRIEMLSQTQRHLERKLQDCNVELLDKMKAIDTAATSQALWKSTTDEIKSQIGSLKYQLHHVDEVAEEALSQQVGRPDANGLLHKLEGLAQKQIELERKVVESNVDLLEKWKAVDVAATSQALWKTNIADVRYQVATMRDSLSKFSAIPGCRGFASK